MCTALITGITSQNCSYLAELLLEKDYSVHAIKRRASSFNTPPIARFCIAGNHSPPMFKYFIQPKEAIDQLVQFETFLHHYRSRSFYSVPPGVQQQLLMQPITTGQPGAEGLTLLSQGRLPQVHIMPVGHNPHRQLGQHGI